MIDFESAKKILSVKTHKIFYKIKENVLPIVVASFILLPIIIFFIISYPHASNSKMIVKSNSNIQILNQLNEMDLKLEKILQDPGHSKTDEQTVKLIQQDIKLIQRSLVEIAKTSDIQQVSKQIKTIQEDIGNQINDLKKTIKSSSENNEVLDPSVLPFHVVSIDIISGQSYISVDYANHILPVAVGDLLGGWRVSNADYDANIAEFINEKNQVVKINLKG
jgi:hypothetical protein